MKVTEFWVERQDLRNTKVESFEAAALAHGALRARVDFFGLTANNVTYAVAGDTIGYWQFFPAEGPWGKVPVWGFADVVQSRCESLPVGERLYGYFPMASHVDLLPTAVTADSFVDGAAHRQALPAVYNAYRRTAAEAAFLQEREVERCLFFPLFITSYLLYDYLLANDCFGAEQIVIGSVSSKTGFGLARLLHEDPAVGQRIVGVTSAVNREFVASLDCCDQIVGYDDAQAIDAALPTAYVDMAGNAALTTALHQRLGERLVASIMVGATHWEARGKLDDLPGARPELFFAPSQIARRDEEWGPGVVMRRAGEASARLAEQLQREMTIERTVGAQALQRLWRAMLDNAVSPRSGQIVSLPQSP